MYYNNIQKISVSRIVKYKIYYFRFLSRLSKRDIIFAVELYSIKNTCWPPLIACLGRYKIKSSRKISRYKIISQRYILSSKDIKLISATVGTTDLRKPHAVHFIESSYIHKGYDKDNSWFNDIALLKVVLIKLMSTQTINCFHVN